MKAESNCSTGTETGTLRPAPRLFRRVKPEIAGILSHDIEVFLFGEARQPRWRIVVFLVGSGSVIAIDGKTAQDSAPAPAAAPAVSAPAAAQAYQEPVYEAPAAVQAPVDDTPYDPFAEEAASPSAPAGGVAQKEIDVANDADWDEFRKCMAGQCECNLCNSDSPPPNAGCYKEMAMEDALGSCVFAIDAAKKDAYKKYFWEEFIPKEADRFCKDRGGEYNADTRKCVVVLTFIRSNSAKKGMFGSSGDNCNDNKPMKVELGGWPKECSAQAFGLGECRKEDPQQQMKDMQMMTGIIKMGTGVLGGVVAGIGAAQDKKNLPQQLSSEEQVALLTAQDSNRLQNLRSNAALNNESAKKDKLLKAKTENPTNAVSAVWDAANQGIVGGTTDMLASGLIKGQGDLVYGRCELSDGTTYREGDAVNLSW